MIYAYGMKNAPLMPPPFKARSGIITGFPVVGKGLGGLPVRAPLTVPHASGTFTVSGELVVPAGVTSITVGGKGEDGYYNSGYWYWAYTGILSTGDTSGATPKGSGPPTVDYNATHPDSTQNYSPTASGQVAGYWVNNWRIARSDATYDYWVEDVIEYHSEYSPDDYYYAQGVTTINVNGTIYTCPAGGYSTATAQNFPVTLRGGGCRITYTVGTGCNFTYSY